MGGAMGAGMRVGVRLGAWACGLRCSPGGAKQRGRGARQGGCGRAYGNGSLDNLQRTRATATATPERSCRCVVIS